jgi:hypothetical protein
MKLAHRIAGVLVAALLLAACDVRDPHHVPRSTEPFPRWEAPGQYGATTGARNIYWIDNERVLYVGREEEEPHERATLRIWTPATGKVEVLGPARGGLCYFRGYVKYVEDIKAVQRPAREGQNVNGVLYSLREGTLGGALETVPDHLARHKDFDSKGLRLHPINCRYYQSKDLEPGENCKKPLLLGDGFLEVSGGRCEPANHERIARLSRREADDEVARNELNRFRAELARKPVQHYAAAGQVVSLPIEANEFDSSGPVYEYLEWKGLYQFPQTRGKDQPTHISGEWPKDQEYVVYLFSTTGAVERVSIPLREHFLWKPAGILITRVGLVSMLPGLAVDRRTGHDGLVLYAQRKPAILDDGVTDEMALSPDGCRLAYSRRTGDATKASPVVKRVRAVDLCSRS